MLTDLLVIAYDKVISKNNAFKILQEGLWLKKVLACLISDEFKSLVKR